MPNGDFLRFNTLNGGCTTDADCDDANDCTSDTCSGGTCVYSNLSSGTLCGNPADDTCNPADTCDGSGVCGRSLTSGGTACGDPTETECSNPDICDGDGYCDPNHKADGTPCTDDGIYCKDDICGDGVCTHPDAYRLDLIVQTGSQYVKPGDPVIITIETPCLVDDIDGVQARMSYDDSIIQLQSIITGNQAGSPWDWAMEAVEWDEAGEIDWAVILPGSLNCTDEAAVVGTMLFTALTDGESPVDFRPDQVPEATKLTDCVTSAAIYPLVADIPLPIVVDSVAPQVSVISIDPDPAGVGTVDIVVEATDNYGLDGVPTVLVTPDGGTPVAAVFVDENPSGTYNYAFAVTAGLNQGLASVSATVADLAGNTAEDTDDTFVIDTGAPTVSITSIDPDPCGETTLTVVVEATDAGGGLGGAEPTVVIAYGDGSTTSFGAGVEGPAGTYTYTLAVPAGAFNGSATVSAEVTDVAGNLGSDSATVVIDTVGPVVTVDAIEQEGLDLMDPSTVNGIRGTVDIVISASDASSALSGDPEVLLTFSDGSTALLTPDDESPAGVFNFSYVIDGTTPNGSVTVEAWAYDDAGNQGLAGAATFDVNTYQVVVNVQLQALNRAITRTVTLVLTDCDGGTDTYVEDLAFSILGVGSTTLTDVDSAMDWISADQGHVLRGSQELSFTATQATADFTGAEQLLAGDFTDDNLVDVEDFALLALNFNTLGDAADATGDGLQGSADFTAIVANFFVSGDADAECSRLGEGSDSRFGQGFGDLGYSSMLRPLRSVSARSLSADLGWAADVNADGWVDVKDVEAFAALYDIRLPRSAQTKLRSLRSVSPTSLSPTESSRSTKPSRSTDDQGPQRLDMRR